MLEIPTPTMSRDSTFWSHRVPLAPLITSTPLPKLYKRPPSPTNDSFTFIRSAPVTNRQLSNASQKGKSTANADELASQETSLDRALRALWDDDDDLVNDESTNQSPEDDFEPDPLPTPPSLPCHANSYPLRPALRTRNSNDRPCQAAVRFGDHTIVSLTWAPEDYPDRKGPDPVQRLTFGELLELHEIKAQLGVVVHPITSSPQVSLGVGMEILGSGEVKSSDHDRISTL